MNLLQSMHASVLREKFIQSFIDQTSAYYIERISNPEFSLEESSYYGYLWECYANCEIKVEQECIQLLQEKKQFYVLWDIHPDVSRESDYWKYPKNSVLSLNVQEYLEICNALPEDIYFFDDSFSWSIALTHETDLGNERWCLLASSKNSSFVNCS